MGGLNQQGPRRKMRLRSSTWSTYGCSSATGWTPCPSASTCSSWPPLWSQPLSSGTTSHDVYLLLLLLQPRTASGTRDQSGFCLVDYQLSQPKDDQFPVAFHASQSRPTDQSQPTPDIFLLHLHPIDFPQSSLEVLDSPMSSP